jgi:hypothetical protein
MHFFHISAEFHLNNYACHYLVSYRKLVPVSDIFMSYQGIHITRRIYRNFNMGFLFYAKI